MQFLLPTTLLLLSSSTLTLAAPTPEPLLAATCSLEYQYYGGTWTVIIPRPYAGGSGCKAVRKTLRESIKLTNKFTCKDDGTGMTKLKFATTWKEKDANVALQKAYPGVLFMCDPYFPY